MFDGLSINDKIKFIEEYVNKEREKEKVSIFCFGKIHAYPNDFIVLPDRECMFILFGSSWSHQTNIKEKNNLMDQWKSKEIKIETALMDASPLNIDQLFYYILGKNNGELHQQTK